MDGLGKVLTEADFRYLIRIAAPQAKEPPSLARALREDPDILFGMLRDSRVVAHLLAEPERVVTSSPRLFFAVLLVRIRAELELSTYTVEQEDRHRMLVFDSREVAGLMHRPDVLGYLVGMLVSFLKVRSQTVMVRLRKGMWSRIDSNDLDLESLLRRGQSAGPDELFSLERRIGDLCLFLSGFFPGARAAPSGRGAGAEGSRERLAEIGRHHYRSASVRGEAAALNVAETLEELARRFEIAVKPLALMASRYLEGWRGRIFAV